MGNIFLPGGGSGTPVIGDNSILDNHIGQRTVDQAIATATSNTGTLTQILSWMAQELLELKGSVNWYDAPAATLVSISSQKAPLANPIFTGTVTLPGNPQSALEAVTKQYVDAAVISGVPPGGAVVLWDDAFTRADSATVPGNAPTGGAYTIVGGTWGILGNKLYAPSDVHGNIILTGPITARDYAASGVILGDPVGAAIFRMPGIVFRYVDANNFWYSNMQNGQMFLTKKDAGVDTNFPTIPIVTNANETYLHKAVCQGNKVQLYLDNILRFDYTMNTNEAAKFNVTNTKAGFRWMKSGASAIAANIDDFNVTTLGTTTVSFDSVTLTGLSKVGPGGTFTLDTDPTLAKHAATKQYVDANIGGAAGAISTPDPNTLMKRDAAGRAQVVGPAVGADIATKNYVDASIAAIPPGGGTNSGTAAATPNTLALRDANGRFSIANPVVASEVANKSYVDNAIAAIPPTAGGGTLTKAEVLGALPSASSTNRGRIVLLTGAVGEMDRTYICKKLANDTYDWKQLD